MLIRHTSEEVVVLSVFNGCCVPRRCPLPSTCAGGCCPTDQQAQASQEAGFFDRGLYLPCLTALTRSGKLVITEWTPGQNIL